jgi:hypothetical protein
MYQQSRHFKLLATRWLLVVSLGDGILSLGLLLGTIFM